jgi:hypothetical protein
VVKEHGSFNEGGAINALFQKKVLGSQDIRAADPKEACTLIERAIDYIQQTENLLEDDEFEEKRKALVCKLKLSKKQIQAADDYRPIQSRLADIVNEIRPIESGYCTRIYDCSRQIQKTFGSNVAWATLSMATLGLVKKPQK